jgi:hypothetical protein
MCIALVECNMFITGRIPIVTLGWYTNTNIYHQCYTKTEKDGTPNHTCPRGTIAPITGGSSSTWKLGKGEMIRKKFSHSNASDKPTEMWIHS